MANDEMVRAQETEAALIVAWLRAHPGDHARVFADAIERGAHRKDVTHGSITGQAPRRDRG